MNGLITRNKRNDCVERSDVILIVLAWLGETGLNKNREGRLKALELEFAIMGFWNTIHPSFASDLNWTSGIEKISVAVRSCNLNCWKSNPINGRRTLYFISLWCNVRYKEKSCIIQPVRLAHRFPVVYVLFSILSEVHSYEDRQLYQHSHLYFSLIFPNRTSGNLIDHVCSHRIKPLATWFAVRTAANDGS